MELEVILTVLSKCKVPLLKTDIKISEFNGKIPNLFKDNHKQPKKENKTHRTIKEDIKKPQKPSKKSRIEMVVELMEGLFDTNKTDNSYDMFRNNFNVYGTCMIPTQTYSPKTFYKRLYKDMDTITYFEGKFCEDNLQSIDKPVMDAVEGMEMAYIIIKSTIFGSQNADAKDKQRFIYWQAFNKVLLMLYKETAAIKTDNVDFGRIGGYISA